MIWGGWRRSTMTWRSVDLHQRSRNKRRLSRRILDSVKVLCGLTFAIDNLFLWLECRKSLLESYVIGDWTSDFEGTRTPIWLPYLEESCARYFSEWTEWYLCCRLRSRVYITFLLSYHLCFPWLHGLGPIKDLGHRCVPVRCNGYKIYTPNIIMHTRYSYSNCS